MEDKEKIQTNIQKIESEIKDYPVKLICVSKTRTKEEIMEAYQMGIRDFGENQVKELVEKRKGLPKDIRWHMIGHLQTNKVKDLLESDVFLIHSVDSLKLAKEIDKRATKRQDVLLEINIAEEKTKYGFLPNETLLKETLKEMEKLKNINIIGLMTVAPKTENPEENAIYFEQLKKLGTLLHLKVLSMGMTNDYLVACKYKATYIRIGTAIFGERKAVNK